MESIKINVNNALMETTQHGTSDFPFQYYYDDIDKYELGHVPWHWHKEFEFVTISSGVLSCYVGNVQYDIEPGDGIFINSGVLHKFEALYSDVHTIAEDILFDPQFIAPQNSKIYSTYVLPFLSTLCISHVVLKRCIPWQSTILDLIKEIYELWKSKDEIYELKINQLSNEIWQILWINKNDLNTTVSIGPSFNMEVRIKQMISYIEQNYEKHIALEDIALSANISKTEALRCFKNYVNRSPIDYLINYRIHKACHLLLDTTMGISDICFECGFSSASYFNRVFKKNFNISPREYRNKKEL